MPPQPADDCGSCSFRYNSVQLGENLILLVNLGWSAALYMRFLTRRGSFAPLERWQTSYIPVYLIWAWIVVAVFPVVFNFH